MFQGLQPNTLGKDVQAVVVDWLRDHPTIVRPSGGRLVDVGTSPGWRR
jgi:hypothetical protein